MFTISPDRIGEKSDPNLGVEWWTKYDYFVRFKRKTCKKNTKNHRCENKTMNISWGFSLRIEISGKGCVYQNLPWVFNSYVLLKGGGRGELSIMVEHERRKKERKNFRHFQFQTFPTSDIPIFTHSQLQTFPISDISNFRHYQLPTFPTSGISNFRHFQLRTFQTSDIPNFRHSQLQTFPTSDISNFRHFQLQTFPTSDFGMREAGNVWSWECLTLQMFEVGDVGNVWSWDKTRQGGRKNKIGDIGSF